MKASVLIPLLLLAAFALVACTPTPVDPYVDCQIPGSVNSCRDACVNLYRNNTNCTEWESNVDYKWVENGSHIEVTPVRNETQCNTWFINATNETGVTCFNVTLPEYSKNVTDWIQVPANCTCWLACEETNVTLRLRVS